MHLATSDDVECRITSSVFVVRKSNGGELDQESVSAVAQGSSRQEYTAVA
jgi:hypothetical protein